jgi:hypothetical protein
VVYNSVWGRAECDVRGPLAVSFVVVVRFVVVVEGVTDTANVVGTGSI